MLRLQIFAGIALFVMGCSEARDLKVAQETPQPVAARSSNQLVQVQGKFVSIDQTGKRHQSFIFTFRIHEELHGLGQAPTPTDELVRFELYQDGGGGDLVAELSGQNPSDGMALVDAATSVTDSSAYQLVLWRFPVYGVGHRRIDAQLVGFPIAVRN